MRNREERLTGPFAEGWSILRLFVCSLDCFFISLFFQAFSLDLACPTYCMLYTCYHSSFQTSIRDGVPFHFRFLWSFHNQLQFIFFVNQWVLTHLALLFNCCLFVLGYLTSGNEAVYCGCIYINDPQRNNTFVSQLVQLDIL
jgi:hypothetical protein